ncbi:MAG: hypothetical protein ABWY93_16045 [Mycobacterium sp.]
MRTFSLIAPLLAAAAIVAAPVASAETHLQCTNPSGNSTQCETPGNVQLNTTPSVNNSYPQYGYPYLYGGTAIDLGGLFGGGGNHGGGGSHGGGGHGGAGGHH